MSTLRSVVPISQGSYRVLKTATLHSIWEHFVAVRAKSMTHLHQDAGHMQNALAGLICRFAPERVLCAIACSCGELHLLFSSHTIRHRARLPNSWGWLCVLFCSAGLVPKLATRASPHVYDVSVTSRGVTPKTALRGKQLSICFSCNISTFSLYIKKSMHSGFFLQVGNSFLIRQVLLGKFISLWDFLWHGKGRLNFPKFRHDL